MTRLLHVTDILAPLYTGPCDQWYLDRGKAVHLACELLDTVGLDRETLDPQLEGYVRAWERCKTETGAEIIKVEEKIGGPEVGYIGTLDRVVEVGKYRELWDLKTGGPHISHSLQLAAYEHAYRMRATNGKGMPFRRRTVHLSGDGTYRLIEHKGADDLRIFLAMHTVELWKIKSGLREMPAPREGEEE